LFQDRDGPTRASTKSCYCKLTHTRIALPAVKAVDAKERTMVEKRVVWFEFHEWFVTVAGFILIGLAVWLA
jgi:hypothetical protein